MKKLLLLVLAVASLAMFGPSTAKAHDDRCAQGTVLTVIGAGYYQYYGCNWHLHFNSIGTLVWRGGWDLVFDSRNGGGTGGPGHISSVGKGELIAQDSPQRSQNHQCSGQDIRIGGGWLLGQPYGSTWAACQWYFGHGWSVAYFYWTPY